MKRKLKNSYSTVQPESWVYRDREQVVAAAPLAAPETVALAMSCHVFRILTKHASDNEIQRHVRTMVHT